MKKGEVLVLNAILSRIAVPEMDPGQLYDYLSMKVDLEKSVDEIQEKAEALRKKTKPESVDENDIKDDDPNVKEWQKTYTEMYNRLLEEPYEGAEIKKCLTKESLAGVVKGLPTNEAVFVFKHIAKV